MRQEALKKLKEEQKRLSKRKNIVTNLPFNVPVFLSVNYLVTGFEKYINSYIINVEKFIVKDDDISIIGKKLAVQNNNAFIDETSTKYYLSIKAITEWHIMKREEYALTFDWFDLSNEYKKIIAQI